MLSIYKLLLYFLKSLGILHQVLSHNYRWVYAPGTLGSNTDELWNPKFPGINLFLVITRYETWQHILLSRWRWTAKAWPSARRPSRAGRPPRRPSTPSPPSDPPGCRAASSSNVSILALYNLKHGLFVSRLPESQATHRFLKASKCICKSSGVADIYGQWWSLTIR